VSSDEEADVPKEMEEVSDVLEVAWEVLDCARHIFSQYSECKQQLSEVYCTLADLSMESDNMEQACSDYQSSLQLKEQFLSSDDRQLAELHYSIGLTLQFQNQDKQAWSHYTSAKKILTTHLINSQTDETVAKDIQSILVDLEEKITESMAPVKIPPNDSSLQGFMRSKLEGAIVTDLGTFGRKRAAPTATPITTATTITMATPTSTTTTATPTSITTLSTTHVKRKLDTITSLTPE